MENNIKKIYEEINRIMANHAICSDKALAFYEGVMWTLSELDDAYKKDYEELCKKDGGSQRW